jgi:hypothetical protein
MVHLFHAGLLGERRPCHAARGELLTLSARLGMENVVELWGLSGRRNGNESSPVINMASRWQNPS